MNSLKGIIKSIKSDEHFSIIEIDSNGNTFKSIIIETADSAPFLKKGSDIKIMFKETEVSIAKNFSGMISMQNKMHCIIKEITKGKLLSKLILDFNDEKIVSIITSGAVEQLNLQVNDNVTALVKTNEVTLAPYE
jgi:molybdopterin-binding protein